MISQWPRLVTAAAGVWLMAMPAVYHYAGTAAAASDRVVGPFVICFAVVAIWEATRAARWANIPFALWALVAPFFLSGYPRAGVIGGVATGFVILAATFPGGEIQQRFGGGWRALARRTPDDQRLRPPNRESARSPSRS